MSTSTSNGYDNQTVDQMNRWQNPVILPMCLKQD